MRCRKRKRGKEKDPNNSTLTSRNNSTDTNFNCDPRSNPSKKSAANEIHKIERVSAANDIQSTKRIKINTSRDNKVYHPILSKLFPDNLSSLLHYVLEEYDNKDELYLKIPEENILKIRSIVNENIIKKDEDLLKRVLLCMNHPVTLTKTDRAHTTAKAMNPLKRTDTISSSCFISESFESIIKSVISMLVQRENAISGSFSKLDRNILTKACGPLNQNYPNTSEAFLMQSSAFRMFHELVGDEILRHILLHGIVFFPIGPSTNFFQLTGSQIKAKGFQQRQEWMTSSSVVSNSNGFCDNNYKTAKHLPRHKIFYSDTFVKKPGLPSLHILNDPKYSDVQVLDSIFQLVKKYQMSSPNGRCVKSKRRQMYSKRWKRLRDRGLDMVNLIRRRQSKFNYSRCLEYNCPLSLQLKENYDGEENMELSLQLLVRQFHSSVEVSKFLRQVIEGIFPVAFWGSVKNREVFIARVGEFTSMRRHERMPESSLLNGIKVLEFSWLTSSSNLSHKAKSNHETMAKLVYNLLKWIVCEFLIPLLRATFYITETEHFGNRVVFYRKPIWSKIRDLSLKTFLVSSQYSELDGPKMAKKEMSGKTMGYSKLRILPKETGVRPIVTLSKRNFVEFEERQCRLKEYNNAKKFLSTNMVLRPTFDVLKYEYNLNPELYGFGILGINEVYEKLLTFKSKFQKKIGASFCVDRDCSKLFFSSLDIRRCYDNINQKQLLKQLGNVLTENQYIIQKLSILYPFDGRRCRTKYHHRVTPPCNFSSFPQMASGLRSKFTNSIFMDNVRCNNIDSKRVKSLLEEHITGHLVVCRGTFGSRYFVQKEGIPQGSKISSFLCNLFYGSIEQDMLGDILFGGKDTESGNEENDDDENLQLLILRLVDDYLLISTDEDISKNFLRRMVEGAPSLGININPLKTKINFDCDRDLMNKLGTDSTQVGRWFPWCGMLIDMKTCEVRVDYSRFKGYNALNGLTVEKVSSGNALRRRMKTFVRPRALCVFYDMRLNGSITIQINFYQMMLLAAIKTVGYVGGLEGKSVSNVNFLVESIVDVISYAFCLVQRRIKFHSLKLGNDGSSNKEINDEKRLENSFDKCFHNGKLAQFYGIHAFSTVMKIKGKPFVKVVHSLIGRTNFLNDDFHVSSTTKSIISTATKDFRILEFKF